MAAIVLRMRVWIRKRLGAIVLMGVVIGVVGGLVIGLAAGTRRTASAPDRYTAWAGGDVEHVLMGQLRGAPLTDSIRQIPGVEHAAASAFATSFLVGPDGEMVLEPNPFAGGDRMAGSRLVEGRFTDPDAPDEFVVNRPLADLLDERYGTRVGDQFEVVSFEQSQLTENAGFDQLPSLAPFTATLVGVVELPEDFDSPSPTQFFSESFLAAHPTVGVVQTIIHVQVDPSVDPATVMAAVRRLTGGEDALPSPYSIVSTDARRAVRFQVTALWVVVAIAAIGTAAVIAQLVRRLLMISDDEQVSLSGIGWRRQDLAAERALQGCLIALIALPVAGIAAFGVTAPFPLGVLDAFEPDPGPRVDWLATVVGVLVTVFVVIGAAATASGRRARRHTARERTGLFASMSTAVGGSMPLMTGARLTTSGLSAAGGRRSLGSLAAGAAGIGGLVAALIVGLSLSDIGDQPDRWGVNYDQLFGNPYLDAQDDLVAPVAHLADVAAVSGVNISGLIIDDRETDLFAFDAAKGNLVPTTLQGRPPSDIDEIGLGAEVARALDIDIGETVTAVGPMGDAAELTVVGIVVTPVSAGGGAAMTFDGLVVLNPTATQNVLVVDFVDDPSPEAVAQVQAANFTPPDALVKPTSVRALQRVAAAPFALAIMLIVLLIVACTYLLTASVRARQRDFTVLRALGAVKRQLNAVVHWHATLTAAAVVAVGLPIGLIVGRWIVGSLTDTLGIVPGVAVPPLMLLAVAVTSIALANVAAFLPARRAARANVVELTRDR